MRYAMVYLFIAGYFLMFGAYIVGKGTPLSAMLMTSLAAIPLLFFVQECVDIIQKNHD